jgi:hypothetical protein
MRPIVLPAVCQTEGIGIPSLGLGICSRASEIGFGPRVQEIRESFKSLRSKKGGNQ